MTTFNSKKIDQQKLLVGLLLLFFVVYVICTVLFQIRSEELPSKSGTVFDQFTGSMLWVASIMALLISTFRFQSIPKFLIWLGISAVVGALAIDEVFEFHERTKSVVGDDDYIKILIWLTAGIGIYILYRIEQPTKSVAYAFILGYMFHTLYLITDMGDGDFFSLPFSITVLVWAEEFFELFFVQSYLLGLILHFSTLSRSKVSVGMKPGSELF